MLGKKIKKMDYKSQPGKNSLPPPPPSIFGLYYILLDSRVRRGKMGPREKKKIPVLCFLAPKVGEEIVPPGKNKKKVNHHLLETGR